MKSNKKNLIKSA